MDADESEYWQDSQVLVSSESQQSDSSVHHDDHPHDVDVDPDETQPPPETQREVTAETDSLQTPAFLREEGEERPPRSKRSRREPEESQASPALPGARHSPPYSEYSPFTLRAEGEAAWEEYFRSKGKKCAQVGTSIPSHPRSYEDDEAWDDYYHRRGLTSRSILESRVVQVKQWNPPRRLLEENKVEIISGGRAQ
ncbi:uncharacterized protein [Littorina saxatilis]|uniref:uncharacterized protein n=1 Tax=Littorina saxatilis TaxID=31220 RepID=UPI0038B53EC5